MPVVRLSGVYGSVNQKPKEKGAEAPLYIGGQEEYLALIQTAQGYYVLPIDWAALNWWEVGDSNP